MEMYVFIIKQSVASLYVFRIPVCVLYTEAFATDEFQYPNNKRKLKFCVRFQRIPSGIRKLDYTAHTGFISGQNSTSTIISL